MAHGIMKGEAKHLDMEVNGVAGEVAVTRLDCGARLYVELEHQHVAVFYDVFLALNPHFAGFFRTGFAA